MRSCPARFLFVWLAFFASSAVSTNSVIEQWNILLINAVKFSSTPPPKVGRNLALVHVAQFEAINAVLNRCAPYLPAGSYDPAGALADPETAAAQAAHDILVNLYPSLQTTFDTALDETLSYVTGGVLTDSVELGINVAAAMLSNRSSDVAHFADVYTVPSPLNDGDWRPTPPAFAPFLLPGWSSLPMWSGLDVTTFATNAPPALDSSQYAVEVEEVRTFGAATGSLRTPRQTVLAKVWAADSGTETPPGLWFVILRQLAADHGLALFEESHVYALLAIAEADAAIACWYTKLLYTRWRPYDAIVTAGIDSSWTSLLVTPPFPSKNSGHSTFSGAAARVLSTYFGNAIQSEFQVCTLDNALCLDYTNLNTAAQEAGQSRIYGGIHYQSDNQDGLSSGGVLGQLVALNCLPLLVEQVNSDPVVPQEASGLEIDSITMAQFHILRTIYRLVLAGVIMIGIILLIVIIRWFTDKFAPKTKKLLGIKAKFSDEQPPLVGNPPLYNYDQTSGYAHASVVGKGYGDNGDSDCEWAVPCVCIGFVVVVGLVIVIWVAHGHGEDFRWGEHRFFHRDHHRWD